MLQQRYPSPSVQLPRTLSRPPFSQISKDAILAIDSDLSNVPIHYIRRRLHLNSQLFQASLSAISNSHHIPSTLQKYQLPTSISIPIRSTTSSYPTHLLALSSSSSKSTNNNDQIPIFPVHAIVIATHCVNFPPIPPIPPSNSSSLTLPVLPLSIPSPAAFPILHTYLYTHSLYSLLSSLLPLPHPFTQSLSTPHAHSTVKETLASGPKLHQLSTYLCTHAIGNLQTLTSHASHVTAFWRNCVALGVYVPELWDAMDLAWEVVLGALNLATAAAH